MSQAGIASLCPCAAGRMVSHNDVRHMNASLDFACSVLRNALSIGHATAKSTVM